MEIRYDEAQYKNFGNCLFLSNHYIELVVTLDLGPRIISYRRLSGENVFFEDIDRESDLENPEIETLFGSSAKWLGYGGHRLWKSPEDYASYYPDHDKVEYRIRENGFDFIAPIQKHTFLQGVTSIDFLDTNSVKITSRLFNRSKNMKTFAVWSLAMLKGPGLEIVPLPQDETAFYPQRIYTLWNFGAKNNDSRAYYGDRYFTLKMEPGNMLAYKVGMRMNAGKVVYLTDKDVFVLKTDRIEGSQYPDYNVNYETYTKHLVLEMETLGPIQNVSPGSFSEHYEIWSIYPMTRIIPEPDDEDTFTDILNIYQ